MSLKKPTNSNNNNNNNNNVGSNNGRNNNNNNLPQPQYDVKTLYHALNTNPEIIQDNIFHTIISFRKDGYHFINSTQVVVPGMNVILTTLYFVYNDNNRNNNEYNNNIEELKRQNYEQKYEATQLGNSRLGGAKPKAKKEPKESKSKKTKKEKM